MTTEEQPSGSKSQVKLVIILALVFVALLVWLLMLLNQSKEQVAQAKLSLDSTQVSLKEANSGIDSLTTELNTKIEEIQKLGGDTAELHKALVQLRLDLRKAKGARAGDLKKIADLNERIEDYLEDLKRKDEEIAGLKKEAAAAFEDNMKLRTSIAKRDDSLSKLGNTQRELDEKIRLAQILRAQGVAMTAIERNGKERKEERYRGSRIDKLKITFTFADNKVAKVETKDVFMRVIEPEGSTLSDASLGGGNLKTREGKDVPYTAKQSLLFDNSGAPVSFVWQKGSDWKSGLHTVEIWCEGGVIGSTSFTVR